MEQQVAADEHRFRAVIDEHAAAVVSFAVRRWPNDAEDLAAQAFAIGWRRWQDDPDQLTVGFLIGTVKNLARNLHRTHEREIALVARITQRGSFTEPDPAQGIGERAALTEALARLSDQDQLVLTLVAWDGADPVLLAQVLGVSAATARVRLHRARRRLMAIYESLNTEKGRRS